MDQIRMIEEIKQLKEEKMQLYWHIIIRFLKYRTLQMWLVTPLN